MLRLRLLSFRASQLKQKLQLQNAAFVFAVGSIGFGFLLGRQSQRAWLIWANILLILSVLALLAVTCYAGKSPILITAALLIFELGQIIPSVILYPLCLSVVPEAKGKVSALIQGGRLILSALSLQIAGYFYTGSFQSIGVQLIIYIALGVVAISFIIRTRLTMEDK